MQWIQEHHNYSQKFPASHRSCHSESMPEVKQKKYLNTQPFITGTTLQLATFILRLPLSFTRNPDPVCPNAHRTTLYLQMDLLFPTNICVSKNYQSKHCYQVVRLHSNIYNLWKTERTQICPNDKDAIYTFFFTFILFIKHILSKGMRAGLLSHGVGR